MCNYLTCIDGGDRGELDDEFVENTLGKPDALPSEQVLPLSPSLQLFRLDCE